MNTTEPNAMPHFETSVIASRPFVVFRAHHIKRLPTQHASSSPTSSRVSTSRSSPPTKKRVPPATINHRPSADYCRWRTRRDRRTIFGLNPLCLPLFHCLSYLPPPDPRKETLTSNFLKPSSARAISPAMRFFTASIDANSSIDAPG